MVEDEIPVAAPALVEASPEPPPYKTAETHVAKSPEKRKKRCEPLPRRMIVGIFIGQLMSFMCVVPGVFTKLNARQGVSVPVFQSMLVYAIFCMAWVLPRVHRFFVHRKRDIILFLVIGCIDAVKSMLDNTAYRFTSVASINVIYNISVPASMVFSWLITKRTYSAYQVVASIICVVAAATYAYVDSLTKRKEETSFVGVVIVLIASILAGLVSVFNEMITDRYSPPQWVARFSITALIIELIVFFAMEYDRDVAAGYLGRPLVWAYIVGHVLADLGYYSTVPWVLRFSNAVVFNVSFITASIYGFFWSHFLFHHRYLPIICLPVLFIISSLLVYFLVPGSDYCCNIKTRKRRAALRKAEPLELRRSPRAKPHYPESMEGSRELTDASSRQPMELMDPLEPVGPAEPVEPVEPVNSKPSIVIV